MGAGDPFGASCGAFSLEGCRFLGMIGGRVSESGFDYLALIWKKIEISVKIYPSAVEYKTTVMFTDWIQYYSA